MHRIRTWARTKAHGSSPLKVNRRGPAIARTDGTTSADDTVTQPSEKTARQKRNVTVRFFLVIKDILFSSPINVLLIFVPVGIAVKAAKLNAGLVFGMNAVAIVPLAGLLSHATESVAKRMGDTIGALLNVTFGNSVELIIFVIALVKNEIRIVQASLIGSILANLLLILGMCFFLGGLRFREQIYSSTIGHTSTSLLSLSVISLLLPTAFHASFSDNADADFKVLQVSRGTSVILLLIYVLYLLFQLSSHSYLYESTPQHIIEQETVPGPAAQYFESSSSSSDNDSATSDSDSSGHSNTTAKRIRRAFRGKKHKEADDKAEAEAAAGAIIAEPHANATEFPLHKAGSMPIAKSEVIPEEVDENQPVISTDREHFAKHVAVDPTDLPEMEAPKKPRTKRHKSRAGPSTEITQNVSPRLDANEPKRVDFAMAPDIEAQTNPSARPKPFSLKTLRPNLAKGLSQTVFTNPAAAITVANRPSNQMSPQLQSQQAQPRQSQPQRGGLQRAQSMPMPQHQSYRGRPGGLPPINPIVVNSQANDIKTRPEEDGKEQEEDDDEDEISRTTAVLLLLGSTGLVALCAEFMVDAISDVVAESSGLSEAFIGLILLPIVGNAAEHVTAVSVAMKNKMDLAIGVAVGSSIQIALFVTPLVVILGWILNKDMSLFFTLFETISLFVSAFIVNFLVLDGRSNYLEGALLCASYIIIGVAAFFYPNADAASAVGGGDDGTNSTVAARVMARGMANLMGVV